MKVTLPINPLFSVRLKKIRRFALPLLGVALVAGCVAATAPLWRSSINFPAPALSSGSVMATDDTIYQGYVINGDIWLRKLKSDGTTLWQEQIGAGPVDEDASVNKKGAFIPVTNGGVIVLSGGTNATWINSDGSQAWSRQVLPAGATIKTWTRFAGDRMYILYQSGQDNIVTAIDSQGNDIWSYTFSSASNDATFLRQGMAVLSSGELFVTLTLQSISDTSVYQGKLYTFDAQGNLANTQDVYDYSELIDNNNSIFLDANGSISRLDSSGAILWTYSFYAPPNSTFNDICAGDGDQAIACTYLLSGYFTTTWLAADGTVGGESTLPNGSVLPYTRGLYYIGNQTWALVQTVAKGLQVLGPWLSYAETSHVIKVLSPTGGLLKTIQMRPTYTYYKPGVLCGYGLFSTAYCPYGNTVGDTINSVYGDAAQVYVTGNTQIGFVSAYPHP